MLSRRPPAPITVRPPQSADAGPPFNNRLGMCPPARGSGWCIGPFRSGCSPGQGPLRQALDPRVQALLNRQARGWPVIEGVLPSHGLPADVALAAIPLRWCGS